MAWDKPLMFKICAWPQKTAQTSRADRNHVRNHPSSINEVGALAEKVAWIVQLLCFISFFFCHVVRTWLLFSHPPEHPRRRCRCCCCCCIAIWVISNESPCIVCPWSYSAWWTSWLPIKTVHWISSEFDIGDLKPSEWKARIQAAGKQLEVVQQPMIEVWC